MTEPPFFLQPVLHSVESVVRNLFAELTTLTDKDVEWVYEQLQQYYKKLAVGKEAPEPLSSSERRQAIIDEILNALAEREEMEADLGCLNNSDCTIGGKPVPSLSFLYAMGFKRLQQSARFWRKKNGPKGYLHFVSSHVV